MSRRRYHVTVDLYLWADSETEALGNAAAYTQHYDHLRGESRCMGVGDPEGIVDVEEVEPR